MSENVEVPKPAQTVEEFEASNVAQAPVEQTLVGVPADPPEGTTVTGASTPVVTDPLKAAMADAGYTVKEAEQIVSNLSQHGLTITTVEEAAAGVEQIVATVKGDPAMVAHVKTVFEEIGVGVHNAEAFFAHLFAHGIAVVPASTVTPSTDASGK